MQYPLQNPLLQAKSSSSELKPYRYTFIRFLVLALLSFVGFANEYTFNNPQALQDTIQQQLHINQSQFNLLYTITAIPNILFSFLSGMLIDYYGLRVTFVIMAILMPLFQAIVAFGGLYSDYTLMLIGRFFLGVVDQSILIALACYVARWFMGKELSLALGLATTLPQFGNALNSYLTPIIYQQSQSLGAPLFTSVGICLIALACACLVTYLDMRADHTDKENGIQVKAVQSDDENQQKFRLSDLKALGYTYWLIAFLCMLALAEYVPFLDNANKLLQVRFCFSQVTAGKNITVTYLVVGIFGFPLGWFLDKIGLKRYFSIVCMVIFTLGHFIILVFPQCSQNGVVREWAGVSWGLFLLGIGYCFYANCLIPSIPLVVKKNVIGTAFGIMEMLENVAMAIYPIIAASIIEKAKTIQTGYLMFSLFYLANGLFGLLLSTCLLFINQKDKKKLDCAGLEHKLEKFTIRQFHTDYEQKQRKRKRQKQKNRRKVESDDCYDEKQSQTDLHIEQKKKFLLQLNEIRQKRLSKSQKTKKFQSDDEDQDKPSNQILRQKSDARKQLQFGQNDDASEQDNNIDSFIERKKRYKRKN